MQDLTFRWQFPHLVRRGLTIPRSACNWLASRWWAPYSRLVLVSDGANWSISWDVRELAAIARRLNIQVSVAGHARGLKSQAVFLTNQFTIMDLSRIDPTSRIGLAYFHGKPSADDPGLARCYQTVVANQSRIDRIQVSNSVMRDLMLASGVEPRKIFVIPIGINLSFFQQQTVESRSKVRKTLGIPDSAVVVGSFQKDGVGWGKGHEPKLIKGPDIFLRVIELLKPHVPELHVLLSGPARGYVKTGLERIGVPYRHSYVSSYANIGALYQALDVYMVTSRDEGGPKAILESMASGVPLVTSQVGQAIDLVRHGENAWMAEVDDVERLAHWAKYVIAHRGSQQVARVLELARQTAEANSYEQQIPLWRKFMSGFIAGSLGRH